MARSTSAGKYSYRGGNFEYQVFLSFRGADTRIFVGHLFNALKRFGFRAFLDYDGLEHGKDIQTKLYEAIHSSEMSIVILSRGYADSRWCLDELVDIMELEALNADYVLPVFFDVEPTVVRNQTGVYMNAFSELEKRFEGDRIKKWKSALKRVADLRGLSLNADRDESLLVENIIQELMKSVTSRLYIPPYIVGRASILADINMWLQDESPVVEVGLITGLGGIGKSTIAMIAYNYNAHLFDGCSFLADFTRKTKQFDGLACLLEQVIYDVTGKTGNKIYNVDKGINDVGALLRFRRVLLVLDDVDELKYFPDAFNDANYFGEGSKIIITTRNEELRKVSLFKKNFTVSKLNFQESKELLKLHAFSNKGALSQRQDGLLNDFLQHCQGLPLALHVMGPLLRDETEETWENLLKELKAYQDHKISDVLRLSFECIEDKYTKDLFLYIACFFVGMDKEYSLQVLEGCKLRPRSGLRNLLNRCLLTIDYQGKLMMHQSIEYMGKEISRQESIDEPGKRSKLWSTRDSIYVLQNLQGTSTVRGLCLYLPKPDNHMLSEPHKLETWPELICMCFSFLNPWRYLPTLNLMSIRISSFTMMSNLELLLLNYVQFQGGYENFPKKIKWLLWPGCPLQSIPSNFNLDELVVLDMQKSCLVNAWKARKYMGALMVLNLSYSHDLVCTPDLSYALMLESLYLEGCVNLVKVHESIGTLINLVHLNLKGCTSLAKMHRSIETLKKLTMLNLAGCKSLTSFPIPISVEQLSLAECNNFFMAWNRMESSVICSSNPRTILSTASSLPQYPVPSTSPFLPFNLYVPALKQLGLVGCGISREDVLGWLSCAPSLKRLNLSDNLIHALRNKDMCSTLKLDYLILRGCTELQSISQLPRGCEVNAACWSSSDSNRIPSIYIAGSYDLVEVDYGCNDRLVIRLIDDLNESQANQLGLHNYRVSVSESILVDIKNRNNRIDRGFYQAGTYQFYLLGDHLEKWFIETAAVEELSFTVPSNQPDIRALNLGFMVTIDNTDFGIYDVKIKNLTSMWEWTLSTPSGAWLDKNNCDVTLTWLSHWLTMEEHREIKPGDLLHISVNASDFNDIVTWGIKIIYEEQ